MSLIVEEHYSTYRVFQQRDKLFNQLGRRFANQCITDDLLGELVDGVCASMPPVISKSVISQSLFELAGESPAREMLFDTFWRLSGNVPLLLAGTPVHPWVSQRGVETVPAQIVDVKMVRLFGELVYSVLFQFLAGSACPLKSHQYWSPRKVSFLAKRRDDSGYGFMFSKNPSSRSKQVIKYPYSDARQLVSMRCLVVLDPDRSKDGPDFQEIRFTSGLSAYNRELLKKRARIDLGYVCPEGFSRTQSCHTCYIGQDKCSASCHPKTYEINFCNGCEQQAYFDPFDSHSYCVNCAVELRKRKT
jgi:hypothetical protein